MQVLDVVIDQVRALLGLRGQLLDRGVWVPETLRTLCDVLILVDQSAEPFASFVGCCRPRLGCGGGGPVGERPGRERGAAGDRCEGLLRRGDHAVE